MIRLGIDSRELFALRSRGVGKTLRELIRHLQRHIPDWGITLFTNTLNDNGVVDHATTRLIDIRGDRYNLWENVRLPVAVWSDGIHLLHCPGQSAPFVLSCPFVLTVHDIIPLRMDDGWSRPAVERFKKSLKRSLERAARIIVISEFTRSDLLSQFSIDERKIDVIHWGIDAASYRRDFAAEWEDIGRRFQLRLPFFLAFGGEAPRKNVYRILEAFAGVVGARAEAQLILVGVPEGAQANVAAKVEQLGLGQHVIQAGFLADSEVTALLSRCEALVYPSLYEGFGVPILEAMAAGAPVITSNTTAMPEVCGDAAVLVDPRNHSEISEAMLEILDNTTLKVCLRDSGYRRIREFSWDRTAVATVATYKKALGFPVP